MTQSAIFGHYDARPLGALTEALTEAYGEPVRTAVAQIAARADGPRPNDRVGELRQARVYDAREAARQCLQPGCWVTLGEVATGRAVTFVEVNVETGAIRERRGERPDAVAPAATRQ